MCRAVQETLNKLRDELSNTACGAVSPSVATTSAADPSCGAARCSSSKPADPSSEPTLPVTETMHASHAPTEHPYQPPNRTQAQSSPTCAVPIRAEASSAQRSGDLTSSMHGSHALRAAGATEAANPWAERAPSGSMHAVSSSPMAVATRALAIGSASNSRSMHATHAPSPPHLSAEASSPLMAMARSANAPHLQPSTSLRNSASHSLRNGGSPMATTPVATAQTPTSQTGDVATVTGFDAPSSDARVRARTQTSSKKPTVRKGQLSEFLAGMIDRSPSPPGDRRLEPPLLTPSVTSGTAHIPLNSYPCRRRVKSLPGAHTDVLTHSLA